MDFHREVEAGCEGIDPAGEICYGLEYRTVFPGAVVRRAQAVVTITDHGSIPIRGERENARRFLEEATEGLRRISPGTAAELDRELESRGFRPVIDAPQLKYKLWQRIVPTAKPRM
jgi:hypothetical protein